MVVAVVVDAVVVDVVVAVVVVVVVDVVLCEATAKGIPIAAAKAHIIKILAVTAMTEPI